MSKQIKQMQMDVLTRTFDGVKDMVFLSASKIDATMENKIRLNLRKKNITMMLVKNSLMRRVFAESKIDPGEDCWVGPTLIAWGADSIKDLSQAVEAAFFKDVKLKEKVRVKTALAEGLPVLFAAALKMPTRKEAIGEIISAMMSAGADIASALTTGACQVASQIQTIAEKKPEDAPAAAG